MRAVTFQVIQPELCAVEKAIRGRKDRTMALDNTLDRSFSQKAMKAELLDAETELALAYAWRDRRDEQA